MKKIILLAAISALSFGAQASWPQDKGKSDDAAKSAHGELGITPLRVQVVFTEYDGDKKIGSLPYTILVNSDDKGPQAAVRMGLRVPIEISGAPGSHQFQYQDVGTNLDGRADRTDDGRFLLKLNVEKSSVYAPSESQKTATAAGNELSNHPIVQTFKTQVNLLIRDGQTIQSTVATDPVSGHVTKLDVTLNVIK
ncbi:MAG TPA: hypothetical protein VKH15_16275 [Candidatus Acidoferrum sp.]|nr:hypothetical protein [Candidatus Acidoferrum sp.]